MQRHLQEFLHRETGPRHARPRDDYQQPGRAPSSPAGIDINLKYDTYGTIAITNSTITDSGTELGTARIGLAIKGRNDAPSYNSNPARLERE